MVKKNKLKPEDVKKLIFSLIAIFVGLAIFIVVVADVGIDKIENAILLLKPWHFAILTFIYGIGFIISTFRWKMILNADGNFAPFRKILAARMVGQSINYLTPSGLVMGEPFKAIMLSGESDINIECVMASVIVEATVFLSTLLLVIIVGVLSFINGVSRLIYYIIMGVLTFLLMIFYLFYTKMIKECGPNEIEEGFFTYIIVLLHIDKISIVNRWQYKISGVEIRVKKFFLRHRKVVVVAIFLSLIEIAVMLFAYSMAISFLGFKTDIKTLLGIFSLMSLANVLPLPGSLGGLEVSQIFAFSFFDLGGQATALAFSLITRIVNLIYVMAGIACLVYFRIKSVAKKIMELLRYFEQKK